MISFKDDEKFASPDQGLDQAFSCCSSISFFNATFDDSVWSPFQRNHSLSDDSRAESGNDVMSRCTSTQESLFRMGLRPYQHEEGLAPSDEEENK